MPAWSRASQSRSLRRHRWLMQRLSAGATQETSFLLIRDLTNMHIFNKRWVEANDAAAPVELIEGKAKPSYLATHILGTGPFTLKSYEPDSRIVLAPNPHWWDQQRHNLTEVVFTPVK